MSLRVGVDMDGTIADLSSAYHEVERRLFGARPLPASPVPDDEALEESAQEEASAGRVALKAARHEAHERDQVWQAIRQTEDFWLGLRPLEPGVVRRLHEVSVHRGWEVFFMTQRPETAGQTVQRQTQQWLRREGFELPSVLTLSGGRGHAAAALELDVLLDDYPKNCVDVLSASRCRPLLVLRGESATTEAAAKPLGITLVRSVAEGVALLEASPGSSPDGVVRRLLGRFGLRS